MGESVTLVSGGHIANGVYAQVHPYFTDTELADLTFAISTIKA